MILFNLRLAIRNFRKNRLYTLINIGGLSIGLAAFILISVFIKYHLSFDKFNKNFKNIYRVNQITDVVGQYTIYPCSPFALIHEIEGKYPEVKSITRILNRNYYISNGKGTTNFEQNGIFADSTLFEIFDYDFLQGDPKKALTGPYSIVLTESLASKYFGNEDPLGKTLRVETGKIFTVTGIIRNTPVNSMLRCRYIMSYDALQVLLVSNVESQWDWCMTNTFVLLDEGVDPDQFSKKIENLSKGKTDKIESNKLILYPLSKIHLQYTPQDDARIYIWMAGLIAALILIIASINFLNLSTAYSSVRVKEIGLRKISGAYISNIIRQFMGEALVITGISLFIALFLDEIALTYIKSLLPQGYSIEYPGISGFVLLILGVTLLTGILAGSYPSLYLSTLMPSRAIKGIDKFTLRSPLISRILVIMQYVFSIVLIISTIIIFLQVKYMQSISLGFNHQYLLTGNCQLTGKGADERYKALKEELLKNPEIIEITQSHNIPFYGAEWWEVHLDSNQAKGTYQVDHNHIDFDYLKTFDIQIIQGRDLCNDSLVDRDAKTCLVNEEAVRKFGWDDGAIGKLIYSDDNIFRVVGVMKNFHVSSVRTEILPCFYSYTTRQFSWPNFYSVKLSSEADIKKMQHLVTRTFKKYFPDDIFDFFDFNRDFAEMNTGFLTSLGNLFAICSSIALLIAVVGLFGLVSYITRQRTKEIGIRKVNGAKSIQLFCFLAKEFLVLIVIANVIAAPASYIISRQILKTMSYQIEIPWLVFLLTATFSVLLTFLIIGSHIAKVANTDPVEALRFE